MATRHLLRTVLLQTLYEWDFYYQKLDVVKILERNIKEFAPGVDEPEFAWKILKGVVEHLKPINTIIIKAAPDWPLEKISIIDRNILRVGIFELLWTADIPPKVAINEAIEVAKKFSTQDSSRFINGILDRIHKELRPG